MRSEPAMRQAYIINNGRETFHCDNRFEALIRPGRQLYKRHNSCGDALLVDLKNSFYAVADSPDRNPSASVMFLKKFHLMLEKLLGHADADAEGWKRLHQQAERIMAETNLLLKTIDYNDNTTFTGVFVINANNERKVFLLHSGDSLLYHLRIQNDIAQKVTQTNHWFIGRSNRLYQTALLDFHPDSRFLLATDGLYDLFRKEDVSASSGLENKIIDIMKHQPIHHVPGQLVRQYDDRSLPSDDIGLIALDPNRIPCRQPGE